MLSTFRARMARRILRLVLLSEAVEQQRRDPPDLKGTVALETVAGSLLLQADDVFITPYMREHGMWEPGETELVTSKLRPGDTFLDIGAHVGYFSCLAARVVGPRGLVFAFEPHPRNYELLLANIWRNGLSNVVAFPWAVTDKNGFAQLFTTGTNTGGHLLYEWPEGTDESLPVRTVALDSAGIVRPPIDMVKIDAQGADDLAVQGMAHLLARSPHGTVLVEFWPLGMRLRGVEPQAVLDFYRSLGWRILVQLPDEHARPRSLSDEEILDYCAGADGGLHVNFLFERP